MSELQFYTKANTLNQVNNATRFDVPIDASHEFYTDFSDVRGDFEEKIFYKTLNVNPSTFKYNESNIANPRKELLFLAGMRGSGKTSELAKITKKLHHREGFFCVTCNLDDGLDVNDMEYMDILIFQLERLFEELSKAGAHLDESIIGALQKWFSERVEEANRAIKKEGGFEVEIKAGTPTLLNFLGITSKVKASIAGSKENATKIRNVLRHNFSDFAKQLNTFIEYVNKMLRHTSRAKELLFVIDGLEKTASLGIRRKIIFEEANRISQVKANTIFTLPIELSSERQKLMNFSTVLSFPFVKIRERNGDVVEKAMQRFLDFTYKRIDASLFDSEETVKEAILLGGGSPREYLRILEYTYLYTDEETGCMDATALAKAKKKLAAETSQYVSKEDLAELKAIKEANEKGFPIPFNPALQALLEKLIVLEYNDGTYKRVNPIVEASALYQEYVEQ